MEVNQNMPFLCYRSLNELFPEPDTSEVNFNFQVPVILPLDFHFRDSSNNLPKCSVDSRTWRENVISLVTQTIGSGNILKLYYKMFLLLCHSLVPYNILVMHDKCTVFKKDFPS